MGGVIGDEDLVHQEGHDGADGHHDDAGQADGVDAADEPPVGPEAPDAQGDVLVLLHVEVGRQQHAADLADDRGDGRAGHAHVEYEDEHRVQDDVDDGAQTLGVHAQQGAARALQQALQHDLAEQGKGAAHDDVEVLLAHGDDLLHLGLGAEERSGTGQAQHAAEGEAHECQK